MIEIEEGILLNVQQYVLSCVIRGLSPATAHRFVSHMDNDLQDDLFEVAAGTDIEMSLSTILDGVIARYGFSEQMAQAVVVHVAMQVMDRVSDRDLGKIRAELSEDLRMLFTRSRMPKVA